MKEFKHKTVKRSFQDKYNAAIAANVAGAAAVMAVPSLRGRALAALTQRIR